MASLLFSDIEDAESAANVEDKSTKNVQDMATIILKLICDGKSKLTYCINFDRISLIKLWPNSFKSN